MIACGSDGELTESEIPNLGIGETTSSLGEIPTTVNPADTILPLPLTDLTAEFDAAVESGDYCEFMSALGDTAPAENDPSGTVERYAIALAGAQDMAHVVPPELEIEHRALVEQLTLAAQAARDSAGKVSDEVLRSLFSAGSSASELNRLDVWQDENCPVVTS